MSDCAGTGPWPRNLSLAVLELAASCRLTPTPLRPAAWAVHRTASSQSAWSARRRGRNASTNFLAGQSSCRARTRMLVTINSCCTTATLTQQRLSQGQSFTRAFPGQDRLCARGLCAPRNRRLDTSVRAGGSRIKRAGEPRTHGFKPQWLQGPEQTPTQTPQAAERPKPAGVPWSPREAKLSSPSGARVVLKTPRVHVEERERGATEASVADARLLLPSPMPVPSPTASPAASPKVSNVDAVVSSARLNLRDP